MDPSNNMDYSYDVADGAGDYDNYVESELIRTFDNINHHATDYGEEEEEY
jgi:hypothetical protein